MRQSLFVKRYANLLLCAIPQRLIPGGNSKKEKNMSRFRFRLSIVFVALVLMFFASSAVRANSAGNKGDIGTTLNVMTQVSVGGTAVAPGTYTVKVDGTKVMFVQNGKTIAQANVEWKDSAQKSPYSNLLAEQGVVKEIHFSGKTRYVTITQ